MTNIHDDDEKNYLKIDGAVLLLFAMLAMLVWWGISLLMIEIGLDSKSLRPIPIVIALCIWLTMVIRYVTRRLLADDDEVGYYE